MVFQKCMPSYLSPYIIYMYLETIIRFLLVAFFFYLYERSNWSLAKHSVLSGVDPVCTELPGVINTDDSVYHRPGLSIFHWCTGTGKPSA